MNNTKGTRAAVPPIRKSFLPDNMSTGPSNNMLDERLAPMTFNMPRDWHMEFKMTATLHGLNMKELLIESFKAWKKQNGK